MKKKYKKIFTEKIDDYKIQVKRNASQYVVKVGKAAMKNFEKKAEPQYFEEPQGVKDHLRYICSSLLIDYGLIENQLNKAFSPRSQGMATINDETMVDKGGIHSWLKNKRDALFSKMLNNLALKQKQ